MQLTLLRYNEEFYEDKDYDPDDTEEQIFVDNVVDNDDAKNEEFSTNIVERPVNDNDTDDVSDEQVKIKKMHEMKRKAIAEHANNLNALDYEDTVAGLKTRFKYRTVEKDAYGLSTEEILTADDKLLGQFVPLKKLAPYRDSKWLAGGKARKKFRVAYREALEKTAKDKQRFTKEENSSSGDSKKRKKRKKMKNNISDSRLDSYGL